MKCNRPWTPWRLPSAVGFLALGFVAIGLLTGCPWSPKKTVTTPVTPSDYLPQTSPANVLQNLQTSYKNRNIDEYTKLFATDFTFVFNPLDPEVPDHPNPPSWGLVDEIEATKNMFTNELVTKIELTSYVLGVPEKADSLYYGPRAWKVQVNEANLQVATRTADGDLLTYLVQGTTEVFFFREEPTKPIEGRPTWYIFRWEDQPIGTKVASTAAGKPNA
jgi:hypothetical protein